MATYSVKVAVDSAWIAQFNKNGMKLCFASCVESGSSSNFNIVAYADSVADTVTIEWKEEYQIAASKIKFTDAVKFTTATTPQDIQFGQSFPIDDSWETQPVNNDKEAPKTGFRFINNTISSAVVYKKVNGVPTAVYFSAGGPLPPGIEDLEPRARAKIWFSSHHQTGSMVSKFNSAAVNLDLTGKTQASVRFDAQGQWNKL